MLSHLLSIIYVRTYIHTYIHTYINTSFTPLSKPVCIAPPLVPSLCQLSDCQRQLQSYQEEKEALTKECHGLKVQLLDNDRTQARLTDTMGHLEARLAKADDERTATKRELKQLQESVDRYTPPTHPHPHTNTHTHTHTHARTHTHTHTHTHTQHCSDDERCRPKSPWLCWNSAVGRITCGCGGPVG